MASLKKFKEILSRLPPEAAEAVVAGGNWDAGAGEPYLLIYGPFWGDTPRHSRHMESDDWRTERAEERFFVERGALKHEILGMSDDGVFAWREEREVKSPGYSEIEPLCREGALSNAKCYLAMARKNAIDPLGLLTPPTSWEFELGESADPEYRYLITRARPIGRIAWYASRGLPAAVKDALGVAEMVESGVISAYGASHSLEELRGWLESDGVAWTSEMTGVIPIPGGAPADVVREAARYAKPEDLVAVRE